MIWLLVLRFMYTNAVCNTQENYECFPRFSDQRDFWVLEKTNSDASQLLTCEMHCNKAFLTKNRNCNIILTINKQAKIMAQFRNKGICYQISPCLISRYNTMQQKHSFVSRNVIPISGKHLCYFATQNQTEPTINCPSHSEFAVQNVHCNEEYYRMLCLCRVTTEELFVKATAVGDFPSDLCSVNNGGCDALTTCNQLGNEISCGPCPTGFVDNGRFGKSNCPFNPPAPVFPCGPNKLYP